MSKPDPPRLPAKLPALDLAGQVPQDFEEYCEGQFTQLDWARQVAENVTFETLRCRSVNLAATQFFGPRINDVIFHECDLANADWPRLIMHRCQMESTRLTGFTATEGHLQNVHVKIAFQNRHAFASRPSSLSCSRGVTCLVQTSRALISLGLFFGSAIWRVRNCRGRNW